MNVRSDALGAERAVGLLLAKLGGEVRTEIEPPTDRVAPPEPLADAAVALVALVTEAGCVPQGNPDRLPTRHANVWLRYPIDGVGPSSRPRSTSRCTRASTPPRRTRDPNRLVPLDAARALVERGRIGRVHDEFFTTTGVDTPVAVATRMGQEIGAETPQRRGRRRDPHRHLRNRNALRGNAGEGVGTDGDPDGVHHGAPDDRADGRREPRRCAAWRSRTPPGIPRWQRATSSRCACAIVERAVEMLETEVAPRTVWEIDA